MSSTMFLPCPRPCSCHVLDHVLAMSSTLFLACPHSSSQHVPFLTVSTSLLYLPPVLVIFPSLNCLVLVLAMSSSLPCSCHCPCSVLFISSLPCSRHCPCSVLFIAMFSSLFLRCPLHCHVLVTVLAVSSSLPCSRHCSCGVLFIAMFSSLSFHFNVLFIATSSSFRPYTRAVLSSCCLCRYGRYILRCIPYYSADVLATARLPLVPCVSLSVSVTSCYLLCSTYDQTWLS
jgi:hypothetical protein